MSTGEDPGRGLPDPGATVDLTTVDLTIIIVNWNTGELLARCLDSLPAASEGLHQRTVVVDNASQDGSVTLLCERYPSVELIESGGNLGFGRACNLVLRELSSPWALILNPDTECPPAAITDLVAAARAHPRAAALGPALADEHGHPVASYGDFPRLRHHLAGWLDPAARWLPSRWRDTGLGRIPPSAPPDRGATDTSTTDTSTTSTGTTSACQAVDYVKGACLLLSATALQRVGLFDERFFMYFEETDWCLRAQQAGFGIYLCPQVTVIHHEGQAAAQVSRFSLAQFQRSYRLFLAKHQGTARVSFFRFLQWCEYSSKACLRGLAPGDRKHNSRLAAEHAYRARLQLRRTIDVQPPDHPEE